MQKRILILSQKYLAKVKKEHVFFLLVLILGTFLRFYHIGQHINFIAEVGDNLLDIKNAYIHKQILLIGPPTSHSWLFFGPLFYWIYGPILILSGFNPVSHAYFGASISLLILIANYYFIRKIFSETVAMI